MLTTSAAAAPRAWGPDDLPYLAGVVCTAPAGSSALVAWPSAATPAPAYALTPVTSTPHGAAAAIPAVDATASTPVPGSTGALAYLLGRHGRSTEPAVVADVAAAVLARRGLDPIAARCLAKGTDGASAADAAALWAEASRLAGPYRVRIQAPARKLILGRPARVAATVTAASGASVPGLTVQFATSEPSAALRPATAVTDAHGRATTTVTVQPGSSARSVPLAVRVLVPGVPVTMQASGAVSLVAAGPARTITTKARLPVDTTADPRLTTGVDRALVLPGAVVRPKIAVTGMRGHRGTAELTVTGPLPIHAGTGCRGATARPSTTTTLDPAPPAVRVTGDGSYQAQPLPLTRPGCYILTSRITTSDAIPDVRREGTRQIVAVAPVHVTVAAARGGVAAPRSPLSATVRVTGMDARLRDVHAGLVGPQPSDDGSCRAIRATRAEIPLTPSAAHGDLVLTGPAVSETGCYGFRVEGTVVIPGLGSVPTTRPAPITATALVLDPSVSVVGLSASHVAAGGDISASVAVSGAWTQPGAVRLKLLHLPYDWRGCFGRDWSQATTVDATGPLTNVAGDGTYRVPSPSVPSDGCWTVVPELTLTANDAVTATGTAPTDSMTAFTALPPAAEPVAARTALHPTAPGLARVISAGLGMLALIVFAVSSTFSIALRDR